MFRVKYTEKYYKQCRKREIENEKAHPTPKDSMWRPCITKRYEIMGDGSLMNYLIRGQIESATYIGPKNQGGKCIFTPIRKYKNPITYINLEDDLKRLATSLEWQAKLMKSSNKDMKEIKEAIQRGQK